MPFSMRRPPGPVTDRSLRRHRIWSPGVACRPSDRGIVLGPVGCSSSPRARRFEDEPAVHVLDLIVGAGYQEGGLAHGLPVEAHAVRELLHVGVLAPVKSAVRLVFADGLLAFAHALVPRAVPSSAQAQRGPALLFPACARAGPSGSLAHRPVSEVNRHSVVSRDPRPVLCAQPSSPPAPETLSSWSGSPVSRSLAPASRAMRASHAMSRVSTMPASSTTTSCPARMEYWASSASMWASLWRIRSRWPAAGASAARRAACSVPATLPRRLRAVPCAQHGDGGASPSDAVGEFGDGPTAGGQAHDRVRPVGPTPQVRRGPHGGGLAGAGGADERVGERGAGQRGLSAAPIWSSERRPSWADFHPSRARAASSCV